MQYLFQPLEAEFLLVFAAGYDNCTIWETAGPPAKERAIDVAAKKFYRACLDTSLPSSTFKSYLDFLLMQKVNLECRKYLPADHAFYDGKAYYYDTSVNPIKAAAAKAIVGVMMNMMKNMGPGSISWPVATKAGDY